MDLKKLAIGETKEVINAGEFKNSMMVTYSDDPNAQKFEEEAGKLLQKLASKLKVKVVVAGKDAK